MSPALWKQMIDIYTLPKPDLHSGCLRRLLDDGLVGSTVNGYILTERGVCMMEMLQKTPLPEHIWVDPRTNRPPE